MKTNVIIKFAVVAMAAFGAYAFSGNNANYFNEYLIREGNVCTDLIEAQCDETGNFTCQILMNNNPITLFDLDCSKAIKHNSSNYAVWK